MYESLQSLSFFAVAVALLVFEVMMMVNAAEYKRWGWFVCMLLLSPVLPFVYWSLI